ncbi:MAG TPA: hypothetical protein PK760_07540 [Flavobacteriales bacterium]|nr:hypothetical protein [Flavobacteriales bacterium]
MLATLFRSNQPATLFAVPVLVALLFAGDLGHPPTAMEAMPLAALVQHLVGGSAWLNGALGFLLLALISVQMAAMSNALDLMERRNHLVAFLFPTLMACTSGGTILEPALLGMPMVLIAFRRTWSLDNTAPAFSALFDSGFWLGLAALCYLPYAALLVVVWASTSLIRPFVWREYVLPVLGSALVFYLSWSVLYLLDRTPWYPLHTVGSFDMSAGLALAGGNLRLTADILVAIVLILGLRAFGNSYSRSVIRVRNLRAAFLTFSVVLLMLLLVMTRVNGAAPPVLVCVPLAVVCAHGWLAPKRPWLADALALGLLGLALCIRWLA